jgi:hypothetical protein
VTKLVNPITIFLDGRGLLLDGGFIYVGASGTDPEIPANQLDLFFDKAQTIPAAQPLRTLGGVIVNGINLGKVYFDEGDYSITVRDSDGNLVYFEPTAFDTGGVAYQAQDADLDAIAAQANSPFGLSVLTAADAAAFRALLALGTIATFDEMTVAQFRANVVGKALSTDKVWGAAASVALAQVAGNVAVDLNAGINFTLAMTGGPWTLSNPTNGKDGQSGKIEITQDATGGRVLNFSPNWIWAGGVDGVLSTAANARDVLYYQVLSDGKAHCSLNKALA